jgi:hypothetical protein
LAITNGYAALAEVKSSLRIPVSDTVDDAMIELAVEAASREIDQACERIFYQASGSRVFVPRDSYVCEIDDLRTLTTLKTSSGADGIFDITWAATDYQLEPLNGIVGGIVSPTTQIRAVDEYLFTIDGGEATVQVTGTWGWTAIPTVIKQATVILASRIFRRNDSPLGVMGFGDMGVVRVSRIDPDIDALIGPFKKIRMS